MEGEVNNIELTSKHITDDLDEEQKAMKLFNLEDKKSGRKETNVSRRKN